MGSMDGSMEKILKPRRGKAFNRSYYHNNHNNINYIYVWKNKKAYITKCDCAYFNNYIYISLILG